MRLFQWPQQPGHQFTPESTSSIAWMSSHHCRLTQSSYWVSRAWMWQMGLCSHYCNSTGHRTCPLSWMFTYTVRLYYTQARRRPGHVLPCSSIISVVYYKNNNGQIRTCSSIIGARSDSSYLVCCMAEIRGKWLPSVYISKFRYGKLQMISWWNDTKAKSTQLCPPSTYSAKYEQLRQLYIYALYCSFKHFRNGYRQDMLAARAHPTMPCMV